MKLLSTTPGTLTHEMVSLLPFWKTVFTRRIANMYEQKYSYGRNSRQYFLLFLPDAQAVTRDQLVVYFHGGGWSLGKPEFFRAHAWQLVQRGYAVVMPSHRRIPRFYYQDMREDVVLLLQALKEVIVEHQLEQKQLIIGGTSSGGTLAAFLVYDKTIKSSLKAQIAGLFLLAAPLDLSKMQKTPVLRAYTRNNWQEASLMNHCPTKSNLPVLLVHGEKDAIVAHESSASFVQQLLDNQCTSVELHSLPNGIHLDASRWGYEDNEVRQLLINWIEEL